jgi:hypothetical protein
MKIGSFQGTAPLPSGIVSNETAGEFTAWLLGTALKHVHQNLVGKHFSFLLTSSFTQEQLAIGLSCHIPAFYDSYKSLVSTFFGDYDKFGAIVHSLPATPTYRGGIILGDDVPYTVSIGDNEIEWTCLLQHNSCAPRFPANTSSILSWIGYAANSCFMHFDDFGHVPLSNAEAKLVERFIMARERGGILALDEIVVDDSNPEIWQWASV